MSPGEDEVRFTRLRLADDEPVAVETTWMPADGRSRHHGA